jgi:putative N6-adenine-specific DNA methylase
MIVVALCAGGMEKITANEVRKLAEKTGRDFRILDSGFGSVRFETCLTGVYYALFSLRSVDRLLLEAADFPAENFDELFERARDIEWENYIPDGMPLAVEKVRSNHSRLAAETSIQAVTHKAAAERLCGRYGRNSLPEGDGAGLRVYIEKDKVQILLDLCGKPLFKRGYRVEGGTAPLRESVAAALLLQSLWRRKYPLYDPFCGSGTIVIEAALYAWDVAPGLQRRFAISDLAVADAAMENEARKSLLERIDTSKTARIFGSDDDGRAVEMAKANLERALRVIDGGRLPKSCLPKLWLRKMEDAKAVDDEGFIITNPPYGLRLLDREEAEAVYRNMAVLRDNFPSWKINVLSAHAGFETFFGESATRCKKFTSGALETYFYEYECKNRRKELESRAPRGAGRENSRNAASTAKKPGGKLVYTW